MPDKNLLIIDDDREIVQALTVRLQAAGYKTLVAFDGQAGVDIATATQPYAIVLDIRMPRLGGLGTLARLRKLDATASLPVVMLSASAGDAQRALALGADYFLEKPYSATNLLAAIEAAAGDRHCKNGIPSCQRNES